VGKEELFSTSLTPATKFAYKIDPFEGGVGFFEEKPRQGGMFSWGIGEG